MKGLAGKKLLGDLAFELDAMRAVLGHRRRPIRHCLPARHKGPLIKGGAFIRAGLHFERLDEPPVLRPMARPGADVSEAELLWKRADTAPVESDSELLCHALEVDTPPRLRGRTLVTR